MDDFLAVIGAHAMRYAIRSGIALTSRYAIGQCSRLLETVDDQSLYTQLTRLQNQLDCKIKVIAPTIDLVEFKSGRGNVFLDSALPLTKALHREIVALGRHVEAITLAHEEDRVPPRRSKPMTNEIQAVISDIQELLARLDREIPLLQLAISASGETLSSSLPTCISPSRLLQASTLLIIADTQYAQHPQLRVQVGPVFSLSLYMLFAGHAHATGQRGKGDRDASSCSKSASSGGARDQIASYGLGQFDRKPIWQEVIHKARVALFRAHRKPPTPTTDLRAASPGMNQYSYYLEALEDQDDGRVHTTGCSTPGGGPAGTQIKEGIPINQISKIFYTDSGKLLNLGSDGSDEKNPVLLLKRDMYAEVLSATNTLREYEGSCPDEEPTGHASDCSDSQAEVDRQVYAESLHPAGLPSTDIPSYENRTTGFPPHLDPEWIAMEMFEEDVSDHETYASDDSTEHAAHSARRSSHGSSCDAIEEHQAHLGSDDAKSQGIPNSTRGEAAPQAPLGGITTSLSLIEMLIRLASLQEFQQTSHLSIPDHVLTFFLEETSTTGLVGEAQRRARREAEGKVGFDPYTDEHDR